jgi:hypothetical protein
MEGEKISEVVNGRRKDIRSCKWKVLISSLLLFTTSDIFSPSIYNS